MTNTEDTWLKTNILGNPGGSYDVRLNELGKALFLCFNKADDHNRRSLLKQAIERAFDYGTEVQVMPSTSALMLDQLRLLIK